MQVELLCLIEDVYLQFWVHRHEDVVQIVPVHPFFHAEICDQLHAHFRSLHFKSLVFLYFYLLRYCPQVGIVAYVLFHLNFDEHVIVLVVLQGDSIAHEQELVREPAVAEEHLRALFKLIFGRAKHIKLVELILRPVWFEIVDVRLRLVDGFGVHCRSFLGDGISVILSFQFFVILFNFPQILHI